MTCQLTAIESHDHHNLFLNGPKTFQQLFQMAVCKQMPYGLDDSAENLKAVISFNATSPKIFQKITRHILFFLLRLDYLVGPT